MIDENNQAWEQELKDRVAAMFAKRLNPLSAELERLEQAVVSLRASANTADPADESEATALAGHVKQLFKEVTDQAEKRYETRLSEELEKTRAEISLNVRQTLEADFERKLTQANTDAQSQMAQLQTQLAAATVELSAALMMHS